MIWAIHINLVHNDGVNDGIHVIECTIYGRSPSLLLCTT